MGLCRLGMAGGGGDVPPVDRWWRRMWEERGLPRCGWVGGAEKKRKEKLRAPGTGWRGLRGGRQQHSDVLVDPTLRLHPRASPPALQAPPPHKC